MSRVLAGIQAKQSEPLSDELRDAARARTSRIRIRLANALPFFGYLLLKLEIEVTRSVLLAAVTQTRRLLINPDWAVGTTDPELASTLVHEVLHPALGVFERKGGRILMVVGPDGIPYPLFFIAHDYAINLIIRELAARGVIQVPLLDPAKWDPPGLVDNKYAKMSAEEIYDSLAQTLPPPPAQGGAANGGGGRKFLPGLDASKLDVQPGAGEGRASLSQVEEDAEIRYWKLSILEAAQFHERSRSTEKGDLPLGIRIAIDQILHPSVSWVDVLSQWIGENGRRSDLSYRRLSRRSESIGEILPSFQRNGVDDVVILWDTSGSMNGREARTMGEILGICADLGLKVRVICCDAGIHSDQRDVQNAEDVDVKGGGGSNFCPAFERLDEEKCDAVVVVFTDGYIDVPESKPESLKAVLWCVWPGEKPPRAGALWGETVIVEEDETVRTKRVA